MRPDPLDAVRAEGRRLYEASGKERSGKMVAFERPVEVEAAASFLYRNATALLADPPPVGLTEDERTSINLARKHAGPPGIYTNRVSELLAIIDRLTGAEP